MTNADRARCAKPVLLIGWHAKAIDALTARGRRVLCVIDPREKDVARRHGFVEHCLVVANSGSSEDVLGGLARARLDLSEFSGVWSAREQGMITAGILARLAGRDGLDQDTAIALRDKYTQKALVRGAGLPVTTCRIADEAADLAECYDAGRIVVKPLAGAATRNTYVAASREETEAIAERIGHGALGPWLVEEFVEGEELHLDGVVRDGELALLGVSRYLQNIIEIRHGGLVGSILLDPGTNAELYKEARALTHDALRALGHRDGVFHLEAFQGAEGLVFSECAGRIGGGLIRDSITRRFGVDMVEAWADIVEGAAFQPGQPDEGRVYGWVHVPAPEGRLSSLPEQEEAAAALPGCVLVRLDAEAGQEVRDKSAGSDVRLARVLVHGADEDEVRSRLLHAVDWFASRVVVADAEQTAVPV